MIGSSFNQSSLGIATSNNIGDYYKDILEVSKNMDSIEYIKNNLDDLRTLSADMVQVINGSEAINEVANAISSIVNVDTALADIQITNQSITDIQTAAGIATKIADIVDNLTNINKVADNIAVVEANASNVSEVANAIDNVNVVADGYFNIAEVASAVDAVNTVAGYVLDIHSVLPYLTDINNLAPIRETLTRLSIIDTEIKGVYDIRTAIESVYLNQESINTVANNVAELLVAVDAVNAVNETLIAINDIVIPNMDIILDAVNQANAAKLAANNAKTSEIAAAASETNAKASEIAAKASEDSAVLSASLSEASKDAAYTSEVNSATSEANTLDYASQASTSATESAASAASAMNNKDMAEKYAVNPENVIVETIDSVNYYSSKHYSIKAAASASTSESAANSASASVSSASVSEANAKVSETNAKVSEINAKASEDSAKISETNAATSETNALVSENNAAVSENNAKISETNAATSELNAKASENAAKNSETNAVNSEQIVTSTVLGAFDTAPTTDSNGNALLKGAIYYDTINNRLKVWDGSVWVDAVFAASGAVTTFNGRDGVVTLSANDINTALGFTVIELTKTNVETLAIAAASLTQDTSNRLVTDIEKTTWNGKQDTIVVDSEPTLNSSNLVTSGTIYDSLSGKLDTSLKGVANGLAELDSNGVVVSAQLPSYVDDVLEYTSLSSFPVTGEASKIYIAQDTNKTYRWSGTAYVNIASDLALGETSSTAYRGDLGKIAYDHSQSAHAPSNATVNSSDAYLLDRTNHTGTQLASTISDLDTAITNNSAVVANTNKVSNVTTNLSTVLDSTTVTIVSSDGTNAVIGSVSSTAAGIMASTDKVKLDSIEADATADQTDAEIEAAYNNQVAVVTQTDAEDGISTTVTRWTAERVKQAIAANNAASADKLSTARTVSLSGDVSGSISFDGSADVDIVVTVADDSHAHVIGDVDNLQSALDAKLETSLKGVAGGLAELDTNGLVPSSQLPSYVDDVLEYNTQVDFPITGDSGKIYIAKDTNKTYRWGGSSYVNIASDLALGETSATAYRGDLGKIAYDHTSRTDNPHSVTKAQVGLGNVVDLDTTNADNITSGTLDTARLPVSIDSDTTGNAATATKWVTARTITLGGDLSGSVSIDGSANVTLSGQVADDSHIHDGRYYTESEADGRFAYKAGTATQGFEGAIFTGDKFVFRPGATNTDDGGIEWLGGDDAGYMRFYTSDDNGLEYMQFGDYDSVGRSGIFSEWLKMYRNEAQFTGNLRATTIYENAVALSSKYLGITAKAADADKLDGNDSSYFATASNLSTHIGSTGSAHGDATTSVSGFMPSSDKSKLDGIEANANNYTLPSDVVHQTSYATSTVGGTLKARLSVTDLYLTIDGSDA